MTMCHMSSNKQLKTSFWGKEVLNKIFLEGKEIIVYFIIAINYVILMKMICNICESLFRYKRQAIDNIENIYILYKCLKKCVLIL